MPAAPAAPSKTRNHLRAAAGAVRSPVATALLAKYRVNDSSIGLIERFAKKASALERRRKFKIEDRGLSADSTFSNLNFSDQAMTGFQTSWSISTITMTRAAKPFRIAGMLSAPAAVCR